MPANGLVLVKVSWKECQEMDKRERKEKASRVKAESEICMFAQSRSQSYKRKILPKNNNDEIKVPC